MCFYNIDFVGIKDAQVIILVLSNLSAKGNFAMEFSNGFFVRKLPSYASSVLFA